MKGGSWTCIWRGTSSFQVLKVQFLSGGCIHTGDPHQIQGHESPLMHIVNFEDNKNHFFKSQFNRKSINNNTSGLLNFEGISTKL